MSSPEHRIVVMRHAKAEQVAASDFDRALSPHGVEDATATGVWLGSSGIVADAAIVSAAARTRQTWQHLAEGAGWTVEPVHDRGLYAADVESALDLVRSQDDAIGTLVVLGHNPAIASLAQLLDDGEGDPDAVNQMVMGFPTSAVAVFGYAGSWADLGPGTARVTAYHVGRADR